MSENHVETLQELVQLTRDAKGFYESAAFAIDDVQLKREFARLADAKAKVIDVLTGHIKARGEFALASGTLGGSLRQVYADLLAAFAKKGTEGYTYAAQLEQAEESLLKRFELALSEVRSSQLHEMLMALLPKLRRSHDDMERLKSALAA